MRPPRKIVQTTLGTMRMTAHRHPIEHQRRYRAALLAYQDANGAPPDRDWRVLLHLLTALPGLWAATSGGLDYARRTADLDPGELTFLSSSERSLLEIGLNLFSGRGTVDLARSIRSLDTTRWQVLIAAIHLYRELPPPFQPPPSSQTEHASPPARRRATP